MLTRNSKILTNFLLPFFQFLLVISSLAIAFSLHLPAKLANIVGSFVSFQFGSLPANPFPDLNPPFPAFGLIAWFMWLLSVMVLLKLYRNRSLFINSEAVKSPQIKLDTSITSQIFSPTVSRILKIISILASLIFILLLIVFSRGTQLLFETPSGQLPASNYDEMVYFTGASLWANGNWPYHDFLLAHPPGAILMLGSWLKILGQTNEGRNAFVTARLLCVVLSVITTFSIFWSAGRLWSKSGQKFSILSGLGAAFVYAVDGRVSEVAVLETISNFWAILAFLTFIEASRQPPKSRLYSYLLLSSGFFAGAAFLAKLPGLAIFVALLVYLLWRNFKQVRPLLWLSGGFGGSLIIIAGVFVVKGGVGEFIRQVVFFQVLRPQEVRSGIDEIARISDYPETQLSILLVAIIILVFTYRFVTHKTPNNNNLWLITLIWSLPLLAVFVFGKSFHPWYYVQWALPLALLAGGLFQLPSPQTTPFISVSLSPYAKYFGWFAILFLLVIPPFLIELNTSAMPKVDDSYQTVADYIHSQKSVQSDIKPQFLSFDPGYAFMSGYAPVRLPEGKLLVDSAGYMVYLNLNMDKRSLTTLAKDALSANRERGQVETTFQKPRAQALVSEGVTAESWIVLDVKLGLAQLTPATVEYLENTTAKPPVSVGSNLVWQTRSSNHLREWHFDNGLQMFPMGLSLSKDGKANIATADNNDTLHITSAQNKNGTLDLRLVWRVTKQQTQPGKIFVHLINEAGHIVAQSDLAPLQGQADLLKWQSGDAFQDLHSLPLPADLPPGRYSVQIGLYNPDNGQRVQVEGQDSLNLGYVEVDSDH